MTEPENTENIGRNPDGTFAKGNPGKPKGALSITAAIRKFLDDNPDKFAELFQDYIEDKKHRELLWKMLDGMPKQQVETEHSGEITIAISEDIAKKYNIQRDTSSDTETNS